MVPAEASLEDGALAALVVLFLVVFSSHRRMLRFGWQLARQQAYDLPSPAVVIAATATEQHDQQNDDEDCGQVHGHLLSKNLFLLQIPNLQIGRRSCLLPRLQWGANLAPGTRGQVSQLLSMLLAHQAGLRHLEAGQDR
jgi:hypothetical protein